MTFIVGEDSEDDGNGNPYLFAFVSKEGARYFETRFDALSFLSKLAEEYGAIECWTTNLEYEIINLFGTERVRELDIQFGKSYIVSARWRGRKVSFRDTIRHLPLSVKALGPLVGLKKIEGKGTHRQKFNIERCVRDATITYRVGIFLSDIYLELGADMKSTLASTALHLWKSQYWEKSKDYKEFGDVALPPDEILEFARESYFGGRTEAFAIGSFRNIQVIDASSMFPWAMLRNTFPVPWGDYERYRKGDEIRANGIYKVKVRSALEIPALPFRTNEGLLFPNGTFEGSYMGEEIIYARQLGAHIDVVSGVSFVDICNPFRGYVTDLFAYKNASRGPKRLAYKLLLNALYGKFSQKGEKIVCMPIEQFRELAEPPEDFNIWNGLALYSEEDQPPPWGNCVWAAMITSAARVRLHKEMMRIKNESVGSNHGRFNVASILYCDTDSIVFAGNNSILKYPAKADRPGDFESRGLFREILLVGKKEYGLKDQKGKWEFHAKGIPFAVREQYLRKGEATFARPVKIRESTRTKETPNVWREMTKRRKVSFANRKKTNAGFLLPPIVKGTD